MPGQVAKYAKVSTTDRLYQGEIVTDLVQVKQSLDSIGGADLRVIEVTHPYALVLTQDCDLEQDSHIRSQSGGGESPLVNILFCEVVAVSELKGRVPQGKDIWKRIIQNKDERYHCIEEVAVECDLTGQGLPALGCDFKRYFTIPSDEVYKRMELNQIRRRCRLVTPYAEHLLSRFCGFTARVPLPENYEIPL